MCGVCTHKYWSPRPIYSWDHHWDPSSEKDHSSKHKGVLGVSDMVKLKIYSNFQTNVISRGENVVVVLVSEAPDHGHGGEDGGEQAGGHQPRPREDALQLGPGENKF